MMMKRKGEKKNQHHNFESDKLEHVHHNTQLVNKLIPLQYKTTAGFYFKIKAQDVIT